MLSKQTDAKQWKCKQYVISMNCLNQNIYSYTAQTYCQQKMNNLQFYAEKRQKCSRDQNSIAMRSE
jgi:hypothetical protein